MVEKKKNPLYVVSEEGSVVEEAFSKLDFFIKKLGLAPLMNMLKELFNQLLSTAQNYQMFVVIKAYIEQVLNQFTTFVLKFAK